MNVRNLSAGAAAFVYKNIIFSSSPFPFPQRFLNTSAAAAAAAVVEKG